MSSSLLLTRRFAPLFWTQFFSAFSDNFLKNSLVFLILFHIGGSDAEALITLAAAVFIAPYFFLSALGGELADRYDKAVVARRLKFAEIGIAFIAVLGFGIHSVLLLFIALFLFGVIASLFGPIKYGILPDHLARSELPAGNALVEGATFIAILLGTIVGGVAAKDGGDPFHFAFLMIVFSLMCWSASLLIPRTGQAAPNLVVQKNILASTAGLLQFLRADPRLLWGALVTSWFWLVGAVALSLMPPLVKNVLGGNEEVVTACLAIFSIFIAVGSGLAAWLAAGRIILLPTLIGAVLLGLFAIDLGWSTHGAAPIPHLDGYLAILGSVRGLRFALDLAGLAIAGGLFIVPTFAAVQAWAGADRRARVVAAVNVLNAAFMAGSTVIVAILQKSGMTTSQLFLLLGVASLLVAIAVGRTMPASALSDALSIIYRALFRIEVRGLDNLNKAGPNVIIALNHVSFLDAGLALSLRDREPVFAIDVGIAKKWWVRPFVKLTNAMPLDPMKPMAIRSLIDAVKGGKALIIFPEGRITVTGSLMKVYDGAAMIADKADAEIVPVRIEGLEQTPFSRLSKGQVRRRWFPKVTVTILEPVRLTVDPELKGRKRRLAAGAALYGIMSDLVFRTTSTDRTVMQAVIQAAATHGRNRVAVEDPVTGALTYKRLLIGAAILGSKLMPMAAEGRAVGVMLPNANGAVVTILGLMTAGRVPAMINFTAGAANILAACRAAQIDTILSSRVFIEKAKLTNLVAIIEKEVRIVYLEDVRASVTIGDKIRGLLKANRPLVERKSDDWAAILFTSGSEGVPKGVVLSHRNMLANAAQAAARIDFGCEDKVFNVLPVFHSFGLTVGVVLPLVSGVRIYLYPIAAALSHRGGADLRRERHHHVRHRHVSGRLCAGRAPLRLPLAALHPGGRGAGQGSDPPDLHGEIRAAHSRRLRRHRDRAGARPEHADVQQVRVGRTHPARHGGAPGEGRGRRGGRPPVRARPERHARLSQGRKPRRARASARRLARHRRHRHHRRAGLPHHQGTRQAVRQDRRGDDLARRGRSAGRRLVAERADGGRGRARPAQGRAAHPADAAQERDPRGIPGLRQEQARLRSDDPIRCLGDRQAADARLRQGRYHGRGPAGAGAARRQAGNDSARNRMSGRWRRQR